MYSELSVVIPTFGRPAQLSSVLDKILESDVSGLDSVEIVVVDDGSPQPVESVVKSKAAHSPFRIHYLRQKNAGPAKARNTGFTRAVHNIVLFIDDDILVEPDLLKNHLLGHEQYPGSVIYGKCPLASCYDGLPAKRYFDSLQAAEEPKHGIEQRFTVASGNLSVEGSLFNDFVYKEDLTTPGAEEFELSHRLNTLRIPIYQNHSAIGWHLQSPLIEDKCKQEFKYGIGVAEAILKVPELSENVQFRELTRINGTTDFRHDSLGLITVKAIKSVVSRDFSRTFLLQITRFVEEKFPYERILFPLYRVLSGLSLFAGVRKGLGRSAQL